MLKTLPPVPFYFGPTGRQIFGWWHRPDTDDLKTAVLICGSHGREEACSHRTISRLAFELAAAGMHALRFDYFGSGNSAGDDFETDLCTEWLQSISIAIDQLRHLSGCQKVALVGLRLGALLAARAASGRDDVLAFVSIAGVSNGRAFVREQQLLRAAALQPSNSDAAMSSLIESGGYLMTPQTAGALAAIDMRRFPRAAAAKWLWLERDDLPSSSALPAHLSAPGCSVERQHFAGYSEMMQDPHHGAVPVEMVEEVVRWLKSTTRAATPVTASRGDVAELPGSVGSVSEKPIWIAAGDARLFGIVTSPVPDVPPRKIIVLLNAGAQRHIGPGRFYVELARAWAAQGCVVLRLDQSGLGDSPPRANVEANVVYSDTAIDEAVCAVHVLRAQWPGLECHVVGLCSGGYHAFKAVLRGAPVEGVVLINPLTFFWREGTPLDAPLPAHEVASEMARYRSNIFSFEPWRKLLRGDVDLRHLSALLRRRLISNLSKNGRHLARMIGVPLRDDLSKELNRLATQGVRLRFVFSEGEPGEDLLRAQGGFAVDRLLDRGALTIDRVAGADHTFTDLQGRTRAKTLLTRLMASATTLPC